MAGPKSFKPQCLREVEALARTHTTTAISVLAEIATDKTAPASARVSAADTLLDRGWGKAKQVVEISTPAEHLTDEQLERQIANRLNELVASGRLGPETSGAAEGGTEEADRGKPERMVH